MTRLATLLSTLVTAGGLFGCQTTANDGCAGADAEARPGAFDPNYAESPAFFTQMPALRDGTSIHQATQIFYSCNLHDRLDARPLEVPEGTVAIKRQGKLGSDAVTALRVMIKKEKGFDPEHGDFAFEARDADGHYVGSGGPSFCFGCHQGYAETGFFAGTSLH